MNPNQLFRIPNWDCSRKAKCIKRTKCFSFVIQLEQIELPPRLSLIYWSLVLEDAEEMVPNNARQLHGHFVVKGNCWGKDKFRQWVLFMRPRN